MARKPPARFSLLHCSHSSLACLPTVKFESLGNFPASHQRTVSTEGAVFCSRVPRLFHLLTAAEYPTQSRPSGANCAEQQSAPREIILGLRLHRDRSQDSLCR